MVGISIRINRLKRVLGITAGNSPKEQSLGTERVEAYFQSL
jgi:hypothetical protein